MPRYGLNTDGHDGLIGDRFEVVRTVGDGSFATVFEAVDIDLGRRVAVKLFDGLGDDSLGAALREARAMARVNHENVLSVHDIGQHRGTPFLAIEFAETDLRRWLARERRDPAQILQLFVEAGTGLAAAHAAGLIHRDFKPANVMVRRNGTVAVGDFGLAHHLESRELLDEGGCALGTLRYICPERLLGDPGDARGDQFSFCLALWEALAERDPFCGGGHAQARYEAILSGPVGQPRAPAHVVRALRRGLDPEPERRFDDMAALLEALTCPAAQRRRKLVRPALSSALLAGVFLLGVFVSREAPALDVDLQPSPELIADAGLDFARDRSFDGQCMDSVKALMNLMPSVREASVAYQDKFRVELEVLAKVQVEAQDYKCATMTYAAAINLAQDLNVDTTALSAKKSAASAKAREAIRKRDPKR